LLIRPDGTEACESPYERNEEKTANFPVPCLLMRANYAEEA
jgi:hypothetical protein